MILTHVIGAGSQLSRPASGTRMSRRSAIKPTGATIAVSATQSHMVSERRSPEPTVGYDPEAEAAVKAITDQILAQRK